MKNYYFQKTPFLTTKEARDQRKWFVIDAEGKTLGRLSTQIATILRGKHRPNYTPHIDCGDGVIVINVAKISLSGAKTAQKAYYRHTGYPGGLVETPFRRTQPSFVLHHAVSGMMPKSKQGKGQLKRLHMFDNANHNMQAQTPQVL